MKDSPSTLNSRIANRVRELRIARGFSLDDLASQSDVSRSMISVVERGESCPTAVVLERLAAGLGVALVSLFDAPAVAAPVAASPIVRHADQAQWRDPTSGYLRRTVSPPGLAQPMKIVEVQLPAGGRVALEHGAHEGRLHQQVWVLEGTVDITLGADRYLLREGDCLAMQVDRPAMFHNPIRKPARYAIVAAIERAPKRSSH